MCSVVKGNARIHDASVRGQARELRVKWYPRSAAQIKVVHKPPVLNSLTRYSTVHKRSYFGDYVASTQSIDVTPALPKLFNVVVWLVEVML